MKFWELTSAFRSETNSLVYILSKPEWEKYKTYYDNIENIVQQQDRSILDEEIPFHLAKEVCEISQQKFFLYYKRKPHLLISYEITLNEPFEEVSAFDILLRFGGSFIEETNERTESDVTPRKLDDKIEVLGANNVTNIGMTAFLRTENGRLDENQIICSLDETRVWTIIKEPRMYLHPYSAHKKYECQLEQGIRQYIIKPQYGVGKPIETEILKVNHLT
jgi:hypothetical protein